MTNYIDLSRPIGSERVRGFQPPWRTVWLYKCENGHTVRVNATSFSGKTPIPGTGAISCPQCPSTWEVLVENVGTVYNGQNGFKARQLYGEYAGKYRPWGCDWFANVVLMRDCEIELEYRDKTKDEDQD